MSAGEMHCADDDLEPQSCMILHGVAPPLSRADPAKSGNLRRHPARATCSRPHSRFLPSPAKIFPRRPQPKAQASLITTNDERPFLRGFVDEGILKISFPGWLPSRASCTLRAPSIPTCVYSPAHHETPGTTCSITCRLSSKCSPRRVDGCWLQALSMSGSRPTTQQPLRTSTSKKGVSPGIDRQSHAMCNSPWTLHPQCRAKRLRFGHTPAHQLKRKEHIGHQKGPAGVISMAGGA